MITYKIKIGSGILEIQDASIKNIHKLGALYGALPSKCASCGSTDVYLSHKSPKGNEYFMIACRYCNAELLFHQKKEGGFYIKQGEQMSVYKGGERDYAPEGKPTPMPIVKPTIEIASDDNPFV